jgi:hypothetical protein
MTRAGIVFSKDGMVNDGGLHGLCAWCFDLDPKYKVPSTKY